MNEDSPQPTAPRQDAEPSAAGTTAIEATLHRYELTIWERAEHWRFYEVVQAVSEADARALFRRSYGKGYRLLHVHSIG